jgi:hypothetical protein
VVAARAALEAKAGDFGLAYRLIDQARDGLGEAAPIWLLMAVEGRRYALPKAVADEFEQRWVAELKKRRRSAALGEMCRTLAGHLAGGEVYPGRDRHLSRLKSVLGRCQRVRWQPQDLRHVLQFLMAEQTYEWERRRKTGNADGLGDASLVLAAIATKARQKFPADAFFQFLVGKLEFDKGPFRCDRRLARDCFERAIALAEGTSDPDCAQTAKEARRSLDLLDAFDRGLDGGPGSADDFEAEDEREPSGDDEEDGIPAAGLADIFIRTCREMGVDPEDVLDKIGGLPGPFRIKGGRRRKI